MWAGPDSFGKVDPTVSTTPGTRRSARGVKRNQPGIDRGDEDSTTTRLARASAEIQPGGDTTRRNKREGTLAVDAWVINPSLLACFCIQRDHTVEGSTEKEHAVDD